MEARMQAGLARDALLTRRGRVACPRCGLPVDLARMRGHLREHHQLISSDVETDLLAARRSARRTGRNALRR